MADGSKAIDAGRTFGTGEFPFTSRDFKRIAALLQETSGIHLQESKAALVYSRLTKRLRALEVESFGEYCRLLANSDEERVAMLAALTTNVTRFFREPHHFEHLKTHVLPPLLERARRGDTLRIWSAGCSSGQEPYSIALSILSLMPDAASYDIRILGTDIEPGVLATGRSGIYRANELSDVPVDLRRRWFEDVPGSGPSRFRVGNDLSALVSFRELNLMREWPMRRLFQAVFCRNVVIYFETATQSRLWSRIVPIMAPGGCLYIGHSERVTGPALRMVERIDTTTYRILEGATR
jgi:chemotaxis protein methyltransferase CheR